MASKKAQGSLVGHGLLPWVTSCQNNKENCSDTIRDGLTQLVIENQSITKNHLEHISAEGIAVSPEIITTIREMDSTQQIMIISKLAQEVSTQRVIDKAFVAKNILETGAQVPVIAANHPAQLIIGQAIAHLDNDIRSLAFEGEIRKKSMSNTLSEIMKYHHLQQQNTMRITPALPTPNLMEDSAMPTVKGK